MSTNEDSKHSNTGSLLHAKGMNPGAMAATLSYLDISQSFGLLDKWTEVKCEDGTKARILKNPEDAFELYAKEWSTKFNVVADLLNQAKVQGAADINNKIVKLFDNLNYIEATLREMYKNAYLTFAATPCKEDSQKEKRAMDRIIISASLSLMGFKMILENKMVAKDEKLIPDAKSSENIDNLNNEMLKLMDKITNMILK
jgi:hypothetical protein